MKNLEAKNFGAFIGHLLNTPGSGGVVEVHRQDAGGVVCSFETFVRWFVGTNRKYLIHLVGMQELHLAPPPAQGPRPRPDRQSRNDDAYDDAWRAVDLWFAHVFDRTLHLTKSEPTHNGHKLLLRLVSRCSTAIRAQLERRRVGELGGRVTHQSLVRLEHLSGEAYGPQMSANARRTLGPLYLTLGSETCKVPDGLSLASAISCAPDAMLVLPLDEELDLIAFMQEAMNTANRHWLFLRMLGLCPPDFMSVDAWEDAVFSTLTMNQAQNAMKWLRRARDLAAADGAAEPGPVHFRNAWDEAPISKRVPYDAFAVSRAGRALMNQTPLRQVSLDDLGEQGFDMEDPTAINAETQISSHEELLAALNGLADLPTLDPVTLRILTCIAQGQTLDDIYNNDAAVQQRYASADGLADAADGLAVEVREAVLSLSLGRA